MRGLSWVVLASVMGVSCGGGDSSVDEGASQADGSADDATARDDSAASEDSSDDGASPSDGTTDAIDPTKDGSAGTGDGAPPSSVVRFVAIGDTGKGNDGQKQVAAAVAAKCAKDGCDFVQLLGDNIYDSGVSSTTDAQWKTKFEEPYAAISLPFYAVLGNHDYGGNGAGTEFGKGQNEVDYSKVSTKWKMPAKYYTHSMKHVDFFALDTNMMMFSMAGDQKTAMNGWIGASKATWKIAFGHHPYYSNGPHGNAGTYEGIPFVPVTSGQGVKDFLDASICGKVDVYICGHDHSRQWLEKRCGSTTELLVSGGGAAVTELKGSNKTYWQEATLGFLYVVLDGNKFTGEMIDPSGKVQYTRTFVK